MKIVDELRAACPNKVLKQEVEVMKKQRLNRIVAFLTALLLVVGMLGPRAYAAEAQTLLKGDANGDNMLDVRDAAAILKEYAHASSGADATSAWASSPRRSPAACWAS